MRHEHLQHRFVDFIPERLEEGVLYVSLEYMTVAHLCCCGCGSEVSITLSPTDWRLIFDGKTVSLEPSIGSWTLPCKSHYFITRNRVVWARTWSREQIQAGRQFDAARKREERAAETPAPKDVEVVVMTPPQHAKQKGGGLFGWLKNWWS